MINLLFVEDNEEVRELYSVIIEGEMDDDINIIEVDNANDAIDKIDQQEEISVILCDFNMPGGNGDLVYNHLKRSSKTIPFIFFTTEDITSHETTKDFFESPNHFHVLKPPADEELSGIIKQVTSVKDTQTPTVKTLENVSENGFVPIRIIRLYTFNEVPYDLYIKLSDVKFVKFMAKGQLYDRDRINEYIGKGVNTLYFKEEDYKIFTSKYTKSLLKKLDDTKIEVSKSIEVEMNAVAFVKELLETTGLSPESMSLVSATVEKQIQNFSNHDILGPMIKSVICSNNFQSQHSVLISYIAMLISRKNELDHQCNTGKTLLSGFYS